uniref:DNA-directed RNA polymerase subunit beta n=1 Tax=Sciadococcus taiwanensis TaxID=3028030 RepID=A0A9Y1MXC3_9RHOD|nr:RNA polymerase beta subunit [Sciadococcus taiwanensis]
MVRKDIFTVPDLVEIQRNSYSWFLNEGLIEELNNFSPITDYTNRLELYFISEKFRLKQPKYSIQESKKRDTSYSAQIYIPTRLINKDSGEIKEQEIFFGELPLMTQQGTFIINGAERVVVNQIVRSSGIYFKTENDKNNTRTFNASIISNRGGWIKFEIDKNDLLWVRIDKTRKIPINIFLKAIGLSENQIFDNLQHPEYLYKTFDKEGEYSEDDALIELYKKIRPGEPATISGGQQLLYSRFFDPKKYDLGKVGRYKINKKLNLSIPESVRILTSQDILATINYLINLKFELGNIDDIDHLGNRRVRSIGELLQNQIRVGLARLERIIKERMTICDSNYLTPSTLINPKPVIASVREFFGSSQLSQFMDQTNPLAELTHKRRISALGPGGLTRERAGFAVRDIHPSHYGRICPIETPEGPNAGLIGSLAIYARINVYGFIEAPFYKVKNGRVLKEQSPIYMSADEEDELKLAPGDIAYSKEGEIKNSEIPIRYRQEFTKAFPEEIDYISVSPIQVISAATSLIPFLEHDDANRALMGSNMQRQAVPLLYPSRPLVGTGLESQIAKDSGMVIINQCDGLISFVSSEKIVVEEDSKKKTTYYLQKYQRSNQDTCINQKPLVWMGEEVVKGQILADGAATEGGELALGQNVLIAYMPWEGYNYEDAFLISERLVYEDLYTSIHIEKYEIESRQTKLGPEEITREIPNVSEYALRQLDEKGIITIGAFVEAGEILIGKVTPKGESDQPPEGKLLRAIFGEKASDVKDSSLRLPNGARGRVVDVRIFSREKGDELPAGANTVIRVYVAQKRKIQVGDKMAGRHGNKGIISRILPRQDMPYLPDGTPVDIVLNPLGVPSRMNVGQVFECLLGLAGNYLNKRFKIPPFDEMYGHEASRILVNQKLYEASNINNLEHLFNNDHLGKMRLYDGRTGETFENPVTVGKAYMLKLVHLVDDKIHARSTGPYSLVTQQPLGGRAQQGGQRLGEMEVWALEAFGASYTLQELLTVKSDDMQGRNEALNAIVKGKPIPKPGTPESFKVLIRELQSLGLDIAAYKIENSENDKNKATEVDLMASTTDKKIPARSTYQLNSSSRGKEVKPQKDLLKGSEEFDIE